MIPINVQKQTRQQVGKAPIPLGTGAFETQMERRTGGIIAQGINNVGAELDEYVANHKAQDVATDQAAFAMHYKNTMTDAKVLAEKTSDPDEVHKIYQAADRNVSDYLGGKNQSGTPNIRWQDHQDKAKLNMSQVKSASHEMAQRRVLDIYKDDSRAKHQRLGMEFIEMEDAEGLQNLGPVMRESGLYTPEEVNLFISKGEQAIDQKKQNADYNAILKGVSIAEQAYETGEIDQNGLITEYEAFKNGVSESELEEGKRDSLLYTITSKQNKFFRKDRIEREKALTDIHKEGETGSFGAGDGTAYLGIFGENMQMIQASAAKLQEGAELFATTFEGEDMKKALEIVDNALAGYKVKAGMAKNDKNYTLAKAVEDIQNLDDKSAYVANYLLGAAMLDTTNGVSDDQAFKITNVKEWAKDETVTVNPGTFLYDVRTGMAPFIMSGNQDAVWVKETFDKAFDWQMGDGKNATDKEKREKISELLGERAKILAQNTPAPQLPSIQEQEEAKSNFDIVRDAYPDWDDAKVQRYLEYKGLE